MKLNTYFISALYITASLIMASCTSEGDKFDYNKNVAYVTGTETTAMAKFVVEDTPAAYAVTVSTSRKVDNETKVKLVLDTSQVAAYNAEHKTNYYPIPKSAIQIDGEDVVIEAGKAVSTAVTVKVISTTDFLDGRTYVIPVTIKEIGGGGGVNILEPSKTLFLRIARVIHFSSLNISNPACYSNYVVPTDKVVTLKNFTFEIKCYSTYWHHIARLCALNSKYSCMLRFGENGLDVNSLQWVCPAGNIVSNTRFNTNQWYHISLTYDGSKFLLYVDGVKDAELTASQVYDDFNFQGFEMGMSWTSYPSQQSFSGRIAEVRVWNRALLSAELQTNICGVDPTSQGLVAYWKLNEGSGYIFHDATGHGYDMDWSKTYREETDGAGMVLQTDKYQYISWDSDAINKCSQ